MSPAASAQVALAPSLRPQAIQSITAEFDLMLACSSVSWSPELEARVRRLLSVPINWPVFWDVSDEHGLLPLIQQRLQGFRSLIPTSTWNQLDYRMAAHIRRALRLTQLLHTVNDALAQAGISALAYKGPVLAERLYGDVAMRQFFDLDLFLPPVQVALAADVLKRIGLLAHTEFRPAEWRELLKSGYELTFDGFGNRNLVEVKWRVLPRFYAIDLATEELFERAQIRIVSDKPLLTLSDEDMFLVLCSHAGKHAWCKLSWISDIARLVSCANLNWEWLRVRAAALGIQRILGISLYLAKELLNAEIPAALNGMFAEDAEIRVLGAQVARNIVSDQALDPESVAYFRFMLMVRERLRDRVRFIRRLIFTPGQSEWSMIRVPAPLFPLYYMVRLFRLIGRILSFNSA
jgi:Uncharacterised nucleotidyltransferase